VVLGAIAKLSKAQNAALPFIRSAVAQGIGATSLYESLQKAGAGVRKTWLLEAYRNESGIVKTGYAVQNVRHDYFPSFDKLAPSVTDTFRKYSFNVGISWSGKYAPDGVTKVYDAVWVTSDEKHSTQWFLDKASEYLDTTAMYEDREYVEPFIIGAMQRR